MSRRSEERLRKFSSSPGLAASRRAVPAPSLPTVVAIPALNEASRIGAALDALLGQRDLDGRPLDGRSVQIAVLANNCTDATAAIVRGIAARAASSPEAPRIHIRELTLPPARAHAGEARRAALDWACDLLDGEADGLLCTTDADSCVQADWIAQTWAERARGAEVIAGTVEFDPAEAASLEWPEGRRLEARYSALQAELIAAIDPEPCNPWPNHIWAWGASLAVTREAYRASGGMPLVRLAEDRAFVALLRQRDRKVRHSLDVRVQTSCRVAGRAPGGLADLISSYRVDADYPCDAELQPATVVAAQAGCRSYLRSIFGQAATAASARRLGLRIEQLEQALAARHFGEAWMIVEHNSTCYRLERLWPANLPVEIERASRLLETLRQAGSADRLDTARAATAGLWSTPGLPPP